MSQAIRRRLPKHSQTAPAVQGDPECKFQPDCGTEQQCRVCRVFEKPPVHPKDEYQQRLITRPATCWGCNRRFEVGKDIAWVWGDPGTWIRYHEACWPWDKQ
jgi:hypothetical protein